MRGSPTYGTFKDKGTSTNDNAVWLYLISVVCVRVCVHICMCVHVCVTGTYFCVKDLLRVSAIGITVIRHCKLWVQPATVCVHVCVRV